MEEILGTKKWFYSCLREYITISTFLILIRLS